MAAAPAASTTSPHDLNSVSDRVAHKSADVKERTVKSTPAVTPHVEVKMVKKRNGKRVLFNREKVKSRISKLAYNLNNVSVDFVTEKVCDGYYPSITTSELDEEASRICATNVSVHPDYDTLAARIAVSHYHKQTKKHFGDVTKALYEYRNPKTGEHAPRVSKEYYDWVMVPENLERLDAALHHNLDYERDLFGFITFKRGYLQHLDGKPVERLQHLLLKAAIDLHRPNMEDVLKSYELQSEMYFSHASPILFQAGADMKNFLSCFTMTVEDSITGIFDAVKKSAQISQSAGGITANLAQVRAAGSQIHGSSGASEGIIPWMRQFQEMARGVNQRGKRNGSLSPSIEPWHADIEEFLNCRNNTGDESKRCHDLFTALWIPGLFFDRVKERVKDGKGMWTLFDPAEAPGLNDVWGEEFNALYTKYEREGLGRKTMPAYELLKKMIQSIVQTGTPYMLDKDNTNATSNQSNWGVVRNMNLCAEITEVSGFSHKGLAKYNKLTRAEKRDPKNIPMNHIAVCNLSSISVPRFVRKATADEVKLAAAQNEASAIYQAEIRERYNLTSEGKLQDGTYTTVQSIPGKAFVAASSLSMGYPTGEVFDHAKLYEVTRFLTRTLNNVIDRNTYPNKESRVSNFIMRPIGLGIQGLANLFHKLRIVFGAPLSRILNADIAETIYFAALTESHDLALKRKLKIKEDLKLAGKDVVVDQYCGAYKKFKGSPLHRGALQFDLFGANRPKVGRIPQSGRWDWNDLRDKVMQDGVYNSLLTAYMPTASTSQMLGNQESFEPWSSMIQLRKTKAGEFIIVCAQLIRDLEALGLWNIEMKNKILRNGGSIQSITEIPQSIRDLYITVWEMPQKLIIDMAVDRQMCNTQSQSMNLHFLEPDLGNIQSGYMYAHEMGLTTLSYYGRTKAPVDAIQFTVQDYTRFQKPELEAARFKNQKSAAVLDVGVGKISDDADENKEQFNPELASSTRGERKQTNINSKMKLLTDHLDSLETKSGGKDGDLDIEALNVIQLQQLITKLQKLSTAKSVAATTPSVKVAAYDDYKRLETLITVSGPAIHAPMPVSELKSSENTTAPADGPIIDEAASKKKEREADEAALMCSLANKGACVMCSA